MAKLLTGTRVYGTANVDNILTVGNITPVNSTSNTTGSLVVIGGVGILGNTYTGNLVISGSSAAGNGITFADGTRQTTAGSSVANTIYLQGALASENANSTLLFSYVITANANSAYLQGGLNTANANIVYIQGGLNTANANTIYTQGVDVTQNARMTIIEGTDVSQNSRMTIIEGTDTSQNVRLDYSNSAITIVQGVDTSQNARMTIIEGVDLTQNTNINNKLSLTGAQNQTVSGNVTISQDLIVSGNLIITGNIGSQNVQQLAVADPLIVLGIGNYTSDTKDIGFAAHYNDGVVNAHSGIIRDSVTKEFYVFKGYTPEVDVTNNVDINDASFAKANLNASYFKGNLIATTAVVNGLELYNYSTAAYAQANVTAGGLITANANGVATDGKMQSAYNQANVTAGGLITANANSAYLQAGLNSANANVVILFGTDVSQNVRLDYSNTAITIVQGVDVSQNSRMTIIEGTDVSQNGRMTIIENTDLSQNVRLDFSNTRMTISDGVNASQNANIVSVQALANTDVTYTTPIAGSYGSSTLVPVVTVASNGRITSITTAAVSGSGSSSNSFSTIKVSGQPDLIANTSISPLTLVAGSGITLSTVGTSNTLTIASTGGFSGGSIANQLIVANTYSSYSNSNNALQVSGGVGVANSVYVGNRVGFGNTSTSLAYTTYNSTLNSIDTYFG